MKYFNKLLLVLLCTWGIALHTHAQDVHFTMYDMSPLTLNPANTGAFLGTVRLNGIVRSQWNRIYDTPSFSADSPIVAVGKKKRDWLGVGLVFVNDIASVKFRTDGMVERDKNVDLVTNYTMLSAAFHKVLDKKSRNVLTVGLQTGIVNYTLKGIDYGAFPSDIEEFINGTSAVSSPIGQLGQQGSEGVYTTENAKPQYNLGLRLSSQLNDDAKLVLGIAFDNPFVINLNPKNDSTRVRQPINQGVGTINTDYHKPTLSVIHATLDYDLTEKFRIRPTALYQAFPGFRNMVVQTHLGYYATDNKDTVINGGLGYRFGDASTLQFIASLEYKSWVLGASYDYSLNAIGEEGRYRSGFEIGLSYIIKIFKEPEVNPAILCPKL